MTTGRHQNFCNYTLLGELGHGGVSTVYRARDNRTGRAVALKLLNKSMQQNELARERFRREPGFQFLHPKIVPVVEAGTCNGQMYFTMNLINGQSLDQIMHGRAMTPRQFYPILRDVAEALDAAHQRYIIHRDIKPSNILISAETSAALLTDFGVAHAAGAQQERITATDLSPIGTPTYMSPEQARGEPNLTFATDIYSLGVVAYHALAGRPPFVADDPLVVANQHASDAPRDLRQIAPSVPAEVSQVVMRALNKKPAERFPSAGAFAHAFTEAVLQSQSRVNPRPINLWGRRVLGAGLALLAVLAGVLLWARVGGLARNSPDTRLSTATSAPPTALSSAVPTGLAQTEPMLPGAAGAAMEASTETPRPAEATATVGVTVEPTSTELPVSTSTPLPRAPTVAAAQTATLAPILATNTPHATLALTPDALGADAPDLAKINITVNGFGVLQYHPPKNGCNESEQDLTRAVNLIEINLIVTNASAANVDGFNAQYIDADGGRPVTCFREGRRSLAVGDTISPMKIGTFVDPATLLKFLILTDNAGRQIRRFCIDGNRSATPC